MKRVITVFYFAVLSASLSFLISCGGKCCKNEKQSCPGATPGNGKSEFRIESISGTCTVVVYDKADHNNLLADVDVVLMENIKKSDGSLLQVMVAEDKTNKIGE